MEKGKRYKIIGFNCGKKATSKLLTMGIMKDSIIKIIAIQPIGPITIKVGKSEYSIGRGLFDKLILEEINESN